MGGSRVFDDDDERERREDESLSASSEAAQRARTLSFELDKCDVLPLQPTGQISFFACARNRRGREKKRKRKRKKRPSFRPSSVFDCEAWRDHALQQGRCLSQLLRRPGERFQVEQPRARLVRKA